jgi:multidrug efflux system outer membrane protein
MRRAWPLAAALALAGCTLGPDYARPPVETPAGWRLPPDAGESLAALPWWELFRDETLQGLIRIALEENKDLRLAVARIDDARAQVRITRADQFPQAGANAQYGRIRTSRLAGLQRIPDDIPVEQDQWTVSLQASYEIDLWGRLRRATEAARAQLLASEAAQRAVVITLVSAVAQSYFDLLDLDRELAITRQSTDSRREWFSLVKLRRDAGIASELDIWRAEEEVASTAAIVPDIERQIAQAENALSILLGRNPGAIPRGRLLADQVLPPAVPAGLPSELLERRPDIQQAEQQLVAANASIGVARAAYFPQISLTALLGVQTVQLADLVSVGSARFGTLGAQLTAPLFTGGRTAGLVAQAESQREQAVIAYQQAIQQAFREVDDALIAHQKAREVREVQERQVVAATRALELARLRYLNGLASYLDVLDALRQLFGAEIDLTRTRRLQLTAIVQLYRALGGGWTPPPAPQAAR